ncbi:MAG: FAD:protein FMN transferase [Treponema sp.]|nr:FAD:protein FMN transferase [Treponema sp.]
MKKFLILHSSFRAFPVSSIVIGCLLFITCEQTESYRIEEALGTVCIITLYDQGKNNIYNEMFSRIHEIENLMSVNIPSSDISRINSNAGIAPVHVNEETFKVIQRALYYAQLSGGAFDPTVGPLVLLWGIGAEPRVPSREEIDQVLPLVNWRNVELNPEESSVFLARRGMALDLGAIAKGYAADEAAKAAKEAGIKRALIDLGGNIVILGAKTDRSPWRVGIQNPGKDRGEIIGFLQITEQLSAGRTAERDSGIKKTIVTSGVYERFFEEDGMRYHHLFSPSQGYPAHITEPAQNNLLSVTIITDISMDADALSTAVFVLGYDKGISLAENIPGTEAIFVFEDRSIIATPGADFTITDNTFYIK